MNANSDIEDTEDLEALFDSIVAANKEAETRVKGVPAVAPRTDHTSPALAAPELVSPLSAPRMNEAPTGSMPVAAPPLRGDLSAHREMSTPSSQVPVFTIQFSDVIDQIGHMTRTLHGVLRELGLNKRIEQAASSISDVRDRLNYVATLTHQAAERVLDATEAAQPLVETMEVEAHRLSGQWQMMYEKQLDVEEFKDLATQTRAFLQDVPKQTKATHAYLMEIMMAQDFQDLTGQVIAKIIDITENLEQQLLALLLESAPVKVKADLDTGLLNGPAIKLGGRKDVASNQNRVDDLLDSLDSE